MNEPETIRIFLIGYRGTGKSTVARLLATALGIIVATGGGVVLRESNRRRLRGAGKVVWLTADLDTICRRLAEDSSTAERRPALTGAAGACARTEVEELLRKREPFYRECADVVLDTTHRSPEDVARELLDLFRTDEVPD